MRSERETIPVTTPRRRPGRPRTKPEGPSKAQRNLMTTLAFELPLLLMELDAYLQSPRPASRRRPILLPAKDQKSASCASPAADPTHAGFPTWGYRHKSQQIKG